MSPKTDTEELVATCMARYRSRVGKAEAAFIHEKSRIKVVQLVLGQLRF